MDQSGQGLLVTASRTRRGLRSQVDQERQAADDAHAASIESLSPEALANENRRLVEEVGRLRKVEEQLMQENASLREDRRKLKAGNREQKRQLRGDGAEIDHLRERYRATMEEKVALAERLAGPAKLPLEILLIVGGFVAGNNDYATLLSFHMMSKCIKEETMPLFYETVLYPDLKYLRFKPGNRLDLDVYRFTKFLYTRKIVSVADMTKLFPKIHAVITVPRVSYGRKPTTYKEYDFDFTVRLRIHRPVRSDILSTLLSCPIKWECSPPTERHPIGAISSVSLVAEGALLGGDLPRNDSLIRNTVARFTIDTRKRSHHAKMGDSIREACRITPRRRGQEGKRLEVA